MDEAPAQGTGSAPQHSRGRGRDGPQEGDRPRGWEADADHHGDHLSLALRGEAEAPWERDVANNSGSVSTNVARAEMRVVSCQLTVMDLLGS